MDVSLEIRKLPIHLKSELVAILELHESWKRLMAIIPKTLQENEYCCDIHINNLAKYRSEHFHLVESHALKYRQDCAEILLREWGSSGRVRARLGHLKYLLEKAELFRAADFVTVKILNQQPPQRPSNGPSAPVLIKSEELKEIETKRIERVLDEISAADKIKHFTVSNNLDTSLKDKPRVIPKIVISECSDFEIAPFGPDVKHEETRLPSDLIKFSTDSISQSDNNATDIGTLPHIDSSNNNRTPTILCTKNSGDEYGSQVNAVIPQFSRLLCDEHMVNSSQTDMTKLPAFSELMDNVPQKFNKTDNNRHMPGLSDIDHGGSNILPAFSQLIQSRAALTLQSMPVASTTGSDISKQSASISTASRIEDVSSEEQSVNLPAFSQLMESSVASTPAASKSGRSCSSPLPNLSLNTHLPHFTYVELEFATNNFDGTPWIENGRFLGSGAFGKVYLAVGLSNKPVAVKKLMLENVDVVRIDDNVTKQFKNEVEILSEYRHENLLSLLGYSCDGSTYCLLYEYIPGGALKDRLQKRELIWTERLYIAIGTAKAIVYLHTAKSTPLIHRDIKSANILLDYTNKPKLCDFGLVKLAPTQNTTTGTTIFGTSAYMAPEAWRGDISVKLDTFSFGVVLLELLTSLPPIDQSRDGVDLITHVEDTCDEDITPLLDVSVGTWKSNNIYCGQELYTLATQCLKEKKNRPSMVVVSQELVKLIQKSS